jgi:hypothetical protein
MTQFFLEAFQRHGVKRGDAFASYAGDIRVEGPHPLCSSGGNLENGRTRTAMYTDCIEQLCGTAGARRSGFGQRPRRGHSPRQAVGAGSCSANTGTEGMCARFGHDDLSHTGTRGAW